jgi:hypothetical protein
MLSISGQKLTGAEQLHSIGWIQTANGSTYKLNSRVGYPRSDLADWENHSMQLDSCGFITGPADLCKAIRPWFLLFRSD